MFATTATEAALYDGVDQRSVKAADGIPHPQESASCYVSGGKRSRLSRMGAAARPSAATNADIKSSLGLGIVRFEEKPEKPQIEAYDYEYRVNTDVITAVRISGGQSDPDSPTRVSFNIGGQTHSVGNVYYPDGDSQLAWVKWRTPDTEQNMTIKVTVSGPGNTAKTTLNVKIVDLDKNPPPNPVADDRNDSFSRVSVPSRAVKSTVSWSVWRPWWQGILGVAQRR